MPRVCGRSCGANPRYVPEHIPRGNEESSGTGRGMVSEGKPEPVNPRKTILINLYT